MENQFSPSINSTESNPFPRPLSISIISILMIFKGINGLVAIFFFKNINSINFLTGEASRLPQIIYFSVAGGVLVLCGVFILKKKNWARWLYTIWSGIGVVLGPVKFGFSLMLLPGTISYLLFIFFLFSKKANNWFNS